jgi:hypothetical protein
MTFPFPTDDDIQALERLPRSAYAEDDMPFLRTQRYCLSPDYEPTDVLAKQRVDMQGAMEMQYSLEQWQKQQG